MTHSEIIDRRFQTYVEALRDGDLARCDAMREENLNDKEIITKFGTLERIWIKEMTLYIREVQIVRRERDGHRSMAEGYRKQLENDKTPPNAKSCINRGKALLAQAEEAMDDHEEVEIALGFTGV